MKMCITSCGKELDSKVEPRFGRSPYYIIWDIDKKTFELIENTNINETSGVGIKSAQTIVDQGCKLVLSGQIGPKATKVLESAGIEIVEGITGTIKESIELFESGNLKKVTSAIKANTIQEEIKPATKDHKPLQPVGNYFRHGKSENTSGKGCGSGRHGGSKRGGNCICPKCSEKIVHRAGVPCRTESCPKCGSQMIRE